ncbi:MAG: heavy-metal-associated domain-containing protein [Gemmatimonadaceae bacterium]
MRTTVTIAGMRSEHCKRAVFTALTPLDGISWADVELGSVTVEHDGAVTVDALRDAIAVSGYVVMGGTEDRRVLPLMHADTRAEVHRVR